MIHFGMFVAGVALAAGVLSQASKDNTGASALQGTWVITSVNGQSIPEGAPQVTLTVTGDAYHQTSGGNVNERGTIRIDASKMPIAVDFIINTGPAAGKTQLGVIEVSGDTMRASLDIPGAGQRPTGFTITDGVIVLVGKKSN